MRIAALNHEQIFYFELGRFVSQFSKAESIVFLFLADLLKITREECAAVTSGAKIDGCCNLIKRVYEARQKDVPPIVLECLDQIGPINKLRNDLLHWGFDSELTVTNAVKALPGRVVSYQVSPDILGAATQDLAKITTHLANIIHPFSEEYEGLATAHKVMNGPWLYKQPLPDNNHRKSQPVAQGQPRPPSPSQG